ncbi:MAG: TetR/AcrR family transcriptional regulator [Kofleriaceae bacterium]|nr:TetR/AcrR family transcriptional regulator [Kofleriaceae bacterium]MCB9574492.1 TetR/AcrR family transcriptional regulator [Kofleriaceae bacterium]
MSSKATPKPTGRAQQKAATRDSLKAAARACFAEQGYAATQIGDIARRAGVAHGTFYVHFPGKEQLTDELLAEYNQALLARLERVWARSAGAPLPERVHALADACLDRWARERELLAAIAERAGATAALGTLREGVSPAVATFLLDQLREVAVAAGLDDAAAELIVQALLGMWLRVGVRYVFGPRTSRRGAADVLTRMSLGALAGVVPALAATVAAPGGPR